MAGFALYCVKNPCSNCGDQWTTLKYDGGWSSRKPTNGTDINSIYKTLEALNSKHMQAIRCGCEFKVVEIE